MMYYLQIDSDKQRFVVEDRNGNIIAIKEMPSWSLPNPGNKVLMEKSENQLAYDLLKKLVDSANNGK